MVGLTGTAWFLIPLAAALALWCATHREWRALTLLLVTGVTVWLLNPGLKRVFARSRPDVRDFVEPTSRWTFPSGHAVASAALALVVVLLAWPTRARRPVTVGAVVYVVAVGLSRLVLGVHFPTDLVAGWALAVAVASGIAARTLARDPRAGPDSGS